MSLRKLIERCTELEQENARLRILCKELADNCEASIVEHGISDDRREYRRGLLARAREAPKPATESPESTVSR